MANTETVENRVAVYTNWSLFGSFGVCLALSGFASSDLLAGLAGYATLLIGFAAHMILNKIFRTGFRRTEVALALVVFSVAVLGFVGSWIFDPHFTKVNIVIGLSGFGAIILGFFAYIIIKYGIRGSYFVIHHMRQH